MLRKWFSRDKITKIGIQPPTPRPGRSGVAVTIIVKNEERHIAEWASFHFAAGITHLYVYDNGCTDKTVEQLKSVVPSDKLTIVPWDQKFYDGAKDREIHNQVLAYSHAIRNFGGSYRWMACIDADEFLVPVRALSINEALEPLDPYPNISLPWHNFGRSGHQTPPDGGVVQNYTQRVANPMSGARGVTNFKVLVDPTRVTAIKVHSYETGGSTDTWNDRGEKFTLGGRKDAEFYSNAGLQLNHYYTRSEEELAAKIARGSNQTVERRRHEARVRRNVENIEAETVEDRLAIEFLERIRTV